MQANFTCRPRLHNLPCLLHDVTHVRKCTRPSPALPYCKQREAGRGPGNKATDCYYKIQLQNVSCTSVGFLLPIHSNIRNCTLLLLHDCVDITYLEASSPQFLILPSNPPYDLPAPLAGLLHSLPPLTLFSPSNLLHPSCLPSLHPSCHFLLPFLTHYLPLLFSPSSPDSHATILLPPLHLLPLSLLSLFTSSLFFPSSPPPSLLTGYQQ